jgi:hypothetical protein
MNPFVSSTTPLSILLIRFPLLAGAIAAVADLILQWRRAAQKKDRSKPIHAIAVGLAGVSVGAAAAVLSTVAKHIAIGLDGAILSGELSAMFDLHTQGGACG